MVNLILEYRDEAQFVAAIFICLAALRWGGGPERAIALVWLLLVEGLDMTYHLLFDTGFELTSVDLFHASLDVLLSTTLIAIALFANRMYTLWVAALQLVATTAHLAREIAIMMKPIAYAVLAIAPSYFQLALLLAGLIYHVRRKQIWGEYRDWRHGTIALSNR